MILKLNLITIYYVQSRSTVHIFDLLAILVFFVSMRERNLSCYILEIQNKFVPLNISSIRGVMIVNIIFQSQV